MSARHCARDAVPAFMSFKSNESPGRHPLGCSVRYIMRSLAFLIDQVSGGRYYALSASLGHRTEMPIHTAMEAGGQLVSRMHRQ